MKTINKNKNKIDYNMESTIIKEISKAISSPSVQAWLTSGFGWLAHYLYVVSNGERFKIYMLLINMFLAFWLGTVIYEFIPESSLKWGIVWIIGFSTYPALAIIEQKGGKFVEKFISK